jgi:hypothetical protein
MELRLAIESALADEEITFSVATWAGAAARDADIC